jgi:hypothetical protein
MHGVSMNLEYELNRRLVNWSYYVIAFKTGLIGYPSKSTIADFGLPCEFVRKSKPPFSLNNYLADEMNAWINIMGKENPHYKEVIDAYYLRDHHVKIWQLAKIFNISKRTFEQRLHEAKVWLKGRLSQEIQNSHDRVG